MIAGVNAVGSPAADFYATPENGSAPLTVAFTDTTNGEASGWAWYFGDGIIDSEWTETTPDAGWSPRGGHSMVVLPDGSIVLMGGLEDGAYTHDVWRSADSGATWSRIAEAPRWPPRVSYGSLLLPDGSIVLMGGYAEDDDEWSYFNDVWRSTDNGATWMEMTSDAEWSARDGHTSVALPDGSILLMGGRDDDTRYGDLWHSTDSGATWTEITPETGWHARDRHASVLLPDGSILVTGGWSYDGIDEFTYYNDVWRLETAGSDVQNPSHLYEAPGSYGVTLRAFNAAGISTLTQGDLITVTEPALAETPAPPATPVPEVTPVQTPTPESSPVVYAPVLLLIIGLIVFVVRKQE